MSKHNVKFRKTIVRQNAKLKKPRNKIRINGIIDGYPVIHVNTGTAQ